MRTTAVASLALLATLSGGMAACGSSTSGSTSAGVSGTTASPTPKDPKDVLTASTPTAAGGAFQFTGKETGLDESGTVDPTDKTLDLKLVTSGDGNLTITFEFVVVEQKVWLKAAIKAPKGTSGLPKIPGKWMLLDPSKINSGYQSLLQFDNPDPSDVSSFLLGLVAAQETGAGQYTGTIDLTKATDQQVVDAATMTALGDAAKAVPFTATLDGKGRLTAFTANIPAAGTKAAQTYAATFTNYGAAPAVSAPPAADTQDAPASVYTLLNGG
jgi:hypothetical protein